MELNRSLIETFRKPSFSHVVVQSLLTQCESIINFSLQEVVFRSILSSKKEGAEFGEREVWEKVKGDLELVNKSLQDICKALDTKYEQ